MVLSNTEILKCIKKGLFSIEPLDKTDLTLDPFNTSAIDLRLGYDVYIPKAEIPIQLDLNKSTRIADFLAKHADYYKISKETPYSLEKNKFILVNTYETVDFSIKNKKVCYCARVEGKSSIARCGVMVHFTAPTIHADFVGRIALEILNLGPNDFLLTPKMPICQLIIEEVKGLPVTTENQFIGQTLPIGVIK